jgi:hypothetical protein
MNAPIWREGDEEMVRGMPVPEIVVHEEQKP